MKTMTRPIEKTPQKRDRGESTRRILQAAVEIFAENGFDGATTKMISLRAGLNESLITRYFKSKANLFIEVTKSAINAIKNEKPYPPAPTVQEEIYKYLIHKFNHHEKNKKFFRVVLSRLVIDVETNRRLHQELGSPLDSFFLERLNVFQKSGMIKPDVDTAQLAALAVEHSFAIGIIKRMCFERSVAECEEASRVFSITMTKGICNN